MRSLSRHVAHRNGDALLDETPGLVGRPDRHGVGCRLLEIQLSTIRHHKRIAVQREPAACVVDELVGEGVAGIRVDGLEDAHTGPACCAFGNAGASRADASRRRRCFDRRDDGPLQVDDHSGGGDAAA